MVQDSLKNMTKVILATGSKQIMLDIPGNNLANIFSDKKNFSKCKKRFLKLWMIVLLKK